MARGSVKILFFGIPAFGHLHPTLPVASELIRRGHSLVYYNAEDFRAPIEKTGALFRVYPSKPDSATLTERLRAHIDNLVSASVFLLEESDRLIPFALGEIRSEAPDLIIFDSIAFWGRHAARLEKVRSIASITTFMLDGAYGLLRLRDFPHLLRSSLPFLPAMVRARRRLKKKYGLSAKDIAPCLGELNLLYTSRDFHPKSSAIDDSFHFLGPSFSAEERTPIDFPWHEIDGARPLIYLSLGTLYNQNADFYRSVLAAFADHPAQWILSVGRHLSAAELGPVPANFIVQQSVPQLEILPRAKLFITHGGMNSLSEALYFGVPLITVPQQIEQTMNGRHVAARGAGLILADRPPYGRGVGAETLRQAVERVLEDPSFRRGAEQISRDLRNGGGAALAAELVVEGDRAG